jgi:hypothetical protein
MKGSNSIPIYILICFLFSCGPGHYKKIHFPELLNLGQYDSINERIGESSQFKTYQVISVLQGECPPCILELQEWQKLIVEFSEFPVDFIFVVHAGYRYNFDEITKKIHFNYPVIFDPDNLFMKSNFPENYNQYPTFLCKDLRIIAAGNPVRSEKTKKEFISLMLKLERR